MYGLGMKVLIVGAIYLVFIILYSVYRDRMVPPRFRSRRTRSLSEAEPGFATTQSLKMDKKIKIFRIGTTVLVAVAFLALALILIFKGGFRSP